MVWYWPRALFIIDVHLTCKWWIEILNTDEYTASVNNGICEQCVFNTVHSKREKYNTFQELEYYKENDNKKMCISYFTCVTLLNLYTIVDRNTVKILQRLRGCIMRERRRWGIHPGFKTHGRSQPKSKTESNSGSTKWWLVTSKFKKKKYNVICNNFLAMQIFF